MASENVKIVIDEYDLTKPGGAGTTSSDIVFIPGFSVKSDAPKNIPTTCYDVYEFEKLFGKEPVMLTTMDVKGYENYGFIAGQFDKSYIYAKELLYQGMPVVYSNLVDPNSISGFNISGKIEVKFIDIATEASSTSDDHISVELVGELDEENALTILDSLKLTIKDSKSFIGEKCIRLTTHVVADGAVDNIPSVTTIDLTSVMTGSLRSYIKSVEVKEGSNINKNVKCTAISKTQFEITNVLENDLEVPVIIDFLLDLDIDFDSNDPEKNIIYIDLAQRVESRLTEFYNTDEDTGDEQVSHLLDQLKMISDKSVYSVKYITSGGYPSVVCEVNEDTNVIDALSARKKFADDLLAAAAERGDAVALIDYQMSADEKSFDTDPNSGSFYAKMHRQFNDVANAEYGAMMYPWGQYSCGATLGRVETAETTDVYMPGSFAYMKCLAKAIKTSPNWLAMAGVTRGLVPGLNQLMVPRNVVSNTIAEEMQPKFGYENHRLSINCITNIRPYGLTLWGNRTLKPVSRDGCVALNFLNTRNMLSDIKKVLYSTAKSLMFEQNSDTLWLRFKAGITPLLNQLKTGQGISDYKIVKGTTKYNGDPLQKGELAAVVKIYPLYAVEYFELAVEINDEEVTVS